jgi:transcriptional regulator with XRE-family HTH domain
MPIVKHASGRSARNQAGILNLIGRYRIEVETFGDRLQKALDQINRERLDAGRDQVKKAHLAKACGVAPASVTQWISGQTKGMKPENLFATADFLGIEPRWLATGEGPMRVNRQNLVDLSHLDPKQRAAFQALICPNGDKGTGGNHRH